MFRFNYKPASQYYLFPFQDFMNVYFEMQVFYEFEPMEFVGAAFEEDRGLFLFAFFLLFLLLFLGDWRGLIS